MQQVARERAASPSPAPPAAVARAQYPGAYSEAAASDGAAGYGGPSPYAGSAVDPLTGARRLRSAPEIFSGGLANLGKNPFGWLFGPPSPLYSNLPRAVLPTYPAAPRTPTPNAAAPMAGFMAAPAAAPPRQATPPGGPPETAAPKSYLRDPTGWSSKK